MVGIHKTEGGVEKEGIFVAVPHPKGGGVCLGLCGGYCCWWWKVGAQSNCTMWILF